METYALLDTQWPLSTTGKGGKLRLKSLTESNDDFPMHMILLRAGNVFNPLLPSLIYFRP